MQRKRRVLAVDDNPLNLEIIQEALDEEWNLRTVTAGKEALEIAVDFQPDIFLLDIMMPEIDGYEVCRRLRANPAFADTPIVMVTAKDSLSGRIDGVKAGADDYITKPFDERGLQESMKFFLETCAGTGSNSETLKKSDATADQVES